MIVAKFGGTSLADAQQVMKVVDIINADSDRQLVVVSAPGKRFATDRKVTDLLLSLYEAIQTEDNRVDAIFEDIALRYMAIAEPLGQGDNMSNELQALKKKLAHGLSRAYLASRGEYLMARLLAWYMDRPFVDAANLIRFTKKGTLDMDGTVRLCQKTLGQNPQAVIPGFYGATAAGVVHTLSRGGSDVSAALVACAVNADLYENWTDTSGIRSADPRVVPDAAFIAALSYRELRELSYMGASVLHEDAVFPVRQTGIPTAVRNTNEPLHPGTMIQYAVPRGPGQPLISGIAGKSGYSVVTLEKDRMNHERGFGRKVLKVFEDHGLNFEHMPTGIDALSVVCETEPFSKVEESLMRTLEMRVHPDQIIAESGLAMIAAVGVNMFRHFGSAARLFTAVAEQGIAIKTMLAAPSELSIIIGVKEADMVPCIRAIYDAFIRI